MGNLHENIQRLIRTVLSGLEPSGADRPDPEESGAKGEATAKVYREEPILLTASQMKSYKPPRYREMRRIAQKASYFYEPTTRIFYEQALFMADFEDDFLYEGEFSRYYPTYQDMNDSQLRGYFSWRTKVRAGEITHTSISFVFVYLYELLNRIGVPSAEAGFYMLRDFCRAYSKLDSRIDRYARLWLRDYVIFYHLDRALLPEDAQEKADHSLLVLMDARAHDPQEIFDALNEHSSYHLENSRFYKEHPEDTREVVARVFISLSDYYEKNRKNSLCEKLFGRIVGNYYTMFESAVVYIPHTHPDDLYEINPVYRYRCRNGSWICERVFWYSQKSKETGALLKLIDFLMRGAYGFKSTLKKPECAKIFTEITQKVIEEYRREKRERERPKIELDLSRLRDIRETALETQNLLLVEPEEAETPVPQPAAPEISAPPVHDFDLTDAEYRLLQDLLYGRPYAAEVRQVGVMLSVLVDAINEKLFDRFGDTVLVFDGETPELLEDYQEELKGIIAP